MSHKNRGSYKSGTKRSYNLDYICVECFNVKTIPISGDMKKPRKFDYEVHDCYNCRKKTQHMCIGNIDIVKRELEFLQVRTSREDRAYELVKSSKTRIY